MSPAAERLARLESYLAEDPRNPGLLGDACVVPIVPDTAAPLRAVPPPRHRVQPETPAMPVAASPAGGARGHRAGAGNRWEFCGEPRGAGTRACAASEAVSAERHLAIAMRLDPRNVSARYTQALLRGEAADLERLHALIRKLLDRPGVFGARLAGDVLSGLDDAARTLHAK